MNIQRPGCARHHPLPPALDASVLRARCICGQALASTSAETSPGRDDPPMEIPVPATRRLPSGALVAAAALALLALLPGSRVRWGGGGDERSHDASGAVAAAPAEARASAPAPAPLASLAARPGGPWTAPTPERGAWRPMSDPEVTP